jgi:hypothetical protein
MLEMRHGTGSEGLIVEMRFIVSRFRCSARRERDAMNRVSTSKNGFYTEGSYFESFFLFSNLKPYKLKVLSFS